MMYDGKIRMMYDGKRHVSFVISSVVFVEVERHETDLENGIDGILTQETRR